MSTHSVVEAKNQLSALIDRALKGERVVITRHGHPVVEVCPIIGQQRLTKTGSPLQIPAVSGQAAAGEPIVMNDAQFDWLERVAITPLSVGQSASELVRQMRDEGA